MQSALRARHRLPSAQHALLRARAVHLTRHRPLLTPGGRPRLVSDRGGGGAGSEQHGSNGAKRNGNSSGGVNDGGGGGGKHKPGDSGGPAPAQGGGGGAADGGSGVKQSSWSFVERMGKAAEEAEASTSQRLQERLHVLGDVINARSHHQREELQRLFKQTLDARSRRLAAAMVAVLVMVGGAMFINRHRAREVVKEELSHAASGALGDVKMQLQATALTLQTLQALLEDPNTQRRSVEFVSALADHPTTRAALAALLVSALKEPAVLQEALELTLWVLDRDDTRAHLVNALVAALQTDQFLQAAGQFAAAWFAREDTREATSELFRSSSLEVLEDEEVRGNARQLVLALLEQPHLQAKTGEHLWAAMKGGILGLGYPKPKAPQPIPTLPATERTTGGAVPAASGGAAGGAPPSGTEDTSELKPTAATAAATVAAGATAGMAAKSADRRQGSTEVSEAEVEAEGGQPLEREFALMRRASSSLERRPSAAGRGPTEAERARGGMQEQRA